MSAKLTADEALNAIRECAYRDGAGVQSAGLAEDAKAAEAAIREAFAIATRAREELARAKDVWAHVDNACSVVAATAIRTKIKCLERIVGEEEPTP
jgi:hypothetical protein